MQIGGSNDPFCVFFFQMGWLVEPTNYIEMDGSCGPFFFVFLLKIRKTALVTPILGASTSDLALSEGGELPDGSPRT